MEKGDDVKNPQATKKNFSHDYYNLIYFSIHLWVKLLLNCVFFISDMAVSATVHLFFLYQPVESIACLCLFHES